MLKWPQGLVQLALLASAVLAAHSAVGHSMAEAPGTQGAYGSGASAAQLEQGSLVHVTPGPGPLRNPRPAYGSAAVRDQAATITHPGAPVWTLQQRLSQSAVLEAAEVVALWGPRYTAYRPLPAEPADVSLAWGNDALWLATETEVGSLRDGVWETPQQPPEITKMFALAVTAESIWAFGLDGGAWRRRGDTWSALPPPRVADFYDAAARSPDDVIAVGFDYGQEEGVIVSWDGASLDPLATPNLHHTLLYAVAITPGGEAWVGGCDYSDRPVLLRDGGTHHWTLAASPPLAGCIYDLAFSPDGLGLAASGSDLLMLDGDYWRPALVRPPEGRQWVRVVGTPAGPATTQESGEPHGPSRLTRLAGTGWAMAGNPTWRGYTGGTVPWYFDGYGWRPAGLDFRGMEGPLAPCGASDEAGAYLDLATDGVSAFSVCRSTDTSGREDRATVVTLDRGVIRPAHPLLETATTVAATGGPAVWAGGRGAWPLVQHRGTWQPTTIERASENHHFAIEVIDLASESVGWALGSESDTYPVSGDLTTWQWNGTAWRRWPLPTGVQMSTRLRASPDGGAWLASRSGQLWAHDSVEWRVVKTAPPVAYEVRSTAGGAPFDLADAGGQVVGCLVANDGLYLYEGGAFRRVGRLPRGHIVDLELADGSNGWAIATDPFAAGTPASPSGVLLRIRDCQAAELRVELPQRLPNVVGTVRDVDWWLLSALSPEEVWLAGVVTGPWLYAPVLVGLAAGSSVASARPLIVPSCAIRSMVALPARSGTDVWLASDAPCGPNPSGAFGRYAGPVGQLAVRAVVGRTYLPSVRRGGAEEGHLGGASGAPEHIPRPSTGDR